MKVHGKLEGAQIEHLDSDPTNLPLGRVFHNKTANKTKIKQNSTVENVATETFVNNHASSTATHGVGTIVGTTETQTLSNKTLASPVVTGTPTGITKTHVGLGNVDNTSDATKNQATANLLNKTIISPTINDPVLNAAEFTDQASTPGPATLGKTKLYTKTDGKIYQQDSNGNETRVGAGSGSGDLNFVTDGDSEGGNIFAVSKNTVAGSRPDTGFSGASVNITMTQSAVNPLNGLKSFVLTKPASINCQGQQGYVQFSIPARYKAKVLTINTAYVVGSGTFTAGSPTTDSDVIAYIAAYNNTSGLWELIEPSSIKLLSNSSTISDVLQSTFQTNSYSTTYRLIFHVATTSTAAFTLNLDDVTVSPSKYVFGTPVSDWKAYVPVTDGFTLTNPNFWWRQVGDSMEIKGFGTVASTNSSIAGVQIPRSIDPAKGRGAGVKTPAQGYVAKSPATGQNPPSSNVGPWFLYTTGNDRIYFSILNQTSADPMSTVAGNGIFNVGEIMFMNSSVPIQGWSSSVQMSDSADTRVVTLSSQKTTTQSITSGIDTVVTGFNTSFTSDKTGSFDPTTGVFTVRTAGTILVNAQAGFAAGSATNRVIVIRKNGASVNARYIIPVASQEFNFDVTALIDVVAGDTITMSVFQNSGGPLNLQNATASAAGVAQLVIQRVSGPSAIAATELVKARYNSTAGNSVAYNTPVFLDFASKNWDSHGAVTNAGTGNKTVAGTGWRFTAPIAGNYTVSANSQIALGQVDYNIQLQIWKNGSYHSAGMRMDVSASTGITGGSIGGVNITDDLELVAGDFVEIVMLQYNNASVARNMSGTNGTNYVTIKRNGF